MSLLQPWCEERKEQHITSILKKHKWCNYRLALLSHGPSSSDHSSTTRLSNGTGWSWGAPLTCWPLDGKINTCLTRVVFVKNKCRKSKKAYWNDIAFPWCYLSINSKYNCDSQVFPSNGVKRISCHSGQVSLLVLSLCCLHFHSSVNDHVTLYVMLTDVSRWKKSLHDTWAFIWKNHFQPFWRGFSITSF